MITATTVAELREVLSAERRAGGTVGFAPTMGYLHPGHASLVERAAAECDTVVSSVFVNPLQFAAGEDLDSYPRDPEGDARTLEAAGCDVMFLPSVDEMYPGGQAGMLTTVSVAELSSRWEGAARPTHFAGVCTVVAKLFHMVGECRAYFGEKDWQQVAVVTRMVMDLSIPVTVVGCPVVREPDGLAMSSRNVRLTPAERADAPVVHRALRAGANLVAAGETDAEVVRAAMAQVVATVPSATVDYLEPVDPSTLEPLARTDRPVRLIAAVQLGSVRLLDNLAAVPGGASAVPGGTA